jgi:hypothetical protein
MVGNNISACECLIVFSRFVEEDQNKVMQFSIFKVHPKFIIAMEVIVVISFSKLDMGTF